MDCFKWCVCLAICVVHLCRFPLLATPLLSLLLFLTPSTTICTCSPVLSPSLSLSFNFPPSCSHLVLLEDHLIVLRECSDRTGWARIKAKHKLMSIVKITMKKKQPDVITFKMGNTAGEEVVVTHIQRFQIPQTTKAIAAIKEQLTKKELDVKDRSVSSPSATPTQPQV